MQNSARYLAAVVIFCTASAVLSAADATFKVDGEGFINNWLVFGPIQVDDRASKNDAENQKDFFDKEQFPGQFKATPAAGDKFKVGAAEIAFKEQKAEDGMLTLTEQDNTLNIIYAYVIAENDIPEAVLSIGSDDGSCWKLNGEELIRVYAGRAPEKDQDKSKPVTIKKGMNILTATIINGPAGTGACARFIGKDGKGITNLAVSLVPVK